MGKSLARMLDSKLGTYISKSDGLHLSRCELESLLESGTRRIIIITGEFNRTFYQHRIGREIATSLHRGIPSVDILLTEKVPGDRQASVEALARDNYFFFDAVYGYMAENGAEQFILENLNFHFSKTRPEKHFSVIDDNVFVEGFHAPGRPRSVYVKKNSRYLANQYAAEWDALRNSGGVYRVPSLDILRCYVGEKEKNSELRSSYGIF